MALWEQILLGIMAAAILFLFWPGVKRSMEQSREEESDWPAVLLPLALVIGFIIVLIALSA